MRRITFLLLMCSCIVTQKTNHHLEYYKFTRSENGDYDLRFKISNGIERSETRRTFKTGDHEVKGYYSYIAPNNQHVIVHYSPGMQGYKIWSSPTGVQEPPVVVRFDVAPFGKGPEELEASEKKKKISRKKIHDHNSDNYGISRTKLLQSAIGPRFENT